MTLTPSSEVINSISNIEHKRCLELGVDSGVTFLPIKCKQKVGVDVVRKFEHSALYQQTTNEFFEQRKNLNYKFDIIYIDACHEAIQVATDYINSLRMLAPEGVLFMHDMYPASPHTCSEPNISNGTAYKFLTWFYDMWTTMGFTVYICKENEGLLLIKNPATISPESFEVFKQAEPTITYELLKIKTKDAILYTHKEMCKIASMI